MKVNKLKTIIWINTFAPNNALVKLACELGACFRNVNMVDEGDKPEPADQVIGMVPSHYSQDLIVDLDDEKWAECFPKLERPYKTCNDEGDIQKTSPEAAHEQESVLNDVEITVDYLETLKRTDLMSLVEMTDGLTLTTQDRKNEKTLRAALAKFYGLID